MCDDIALQAAPETPALPATWTDILQFAQGFTSLTLQEDGKVWVRRGLGDVLHTLGYYAEQIHSRETLAVRLAIMGDVLKHIANNLDD